MADIEMIATVLENIADIKNMHLIREYAPAYFQGKGIEYDHIHLPDVPDLTKATTLGDLDILLKVFIQLAKDQKALPDGDLEGDIIESSKGSKYYNELPMGRHAEAFLSAYYRLTEESTGDYTVDMYDLNCEVFRCETEELAEELAGSIAPSTVFYLDNSVHPPMSVELYSM